MSAHRDKSQKIAFVYSNFYQIYRQGKKAAELAPDAAPQSQPQAHSAGLMPHPAPPRPLAQLSPQAFGEAQLAPVAVIREPQASVRISPHSPPEFIAKRIQAPEANRANPAMQSLKENLKTLGDLHSRLRFMLRELEDLIKE